MKHIKNFNENYLTDLTDSMKFKSSNIKIGDKVKFIEGELPKYLNDTIWIVDKLNYKECKFQLISNDDKKHKIQVHISKINIIKKLKNK